MQGERNKPKSGADIESAALSQFRLMILPRLISKQATVFDPTVALACV
jgi:hypothetical protein